MLSMTTLLTIALAPLLGAVVAGLFGRQVGRTGAHAITIASVAVSCLLSCQVLYQLATYQVDPFNQNVYTFFEVGGYSAYIGFMVDRLSAMMMAVVTFVSLLVHIYTIGYMKDDPGYQRFFSYISLFTFSMLLLVMSNNFLQLFIGWEAVGLVSYLLIGFWFKRPTAIFANMKAFLVNRVGDFGFILGIGLILAFAGTLNYGEAFAKAGDLAKLAFPLPLWGADGWRLITVICICLFIGAMGKSAQFPLHVWLPDSMEGPTPISALIHAATMVTAGIFMVARMSPLFELSDTALSFVLIIGSITALFMGFMGVIQNDIKRVVAYSTLSQLGYMTVALGVSAYPVAVFHLMTHAFFKALLFLAAGSVIMGMHHDQDIRNMGGLRKYMPITWITSLLGSLALIGTPFFAGFYSKDSIITVVESGKLFGSTFAYIAVAAGVFITAFYSFRMYFLVFHGEERFRHKPFPPPDEHHDDADHGHHGHHVHVPHESPWVVTVPLMILAVPSVVIGFFTEGPLIFGGYFKDAITIDTAAHPAMTELGSLWHGPVAFALHAFTGPVLWLAAGGVALAWFFYMKRPDIPAAIQRRFFGLYTLLENKYYLDWFNEHVLAAGARRIGNLFWQKGDAGLIDGVLIDGSAAGIGRAAGRARLLQSGYLYWYALVMIIGVIALMTWKLWPYLTAMLAR